jgi:peptide/nickel transport system permease protein
MSPRLGPFGRTPSEQAAMDQASKGFEASADNGVTPNGDYGASPVGVVDEVEHQVVGSSLHISGTKNFDPDAIATVGDFVDVGTIEPPGEHFETDKPIPMWRQMLTVYVQNRLAVLSTFVLVVIVLGCYVGPSFYHTNQTNFGTLLNLNTCYNCAPGAGRPLGTDSNGFDVLGRIMYGGQSSLLVGLIAGVITIVVGTVYGMVSGFIGGLLDNVLMRIIDALLSIPLLYLLITLVVIFHPSTTLIIIIIGFTGWFGNARIIRGDALVIRELEYSQASTSMGGSKMHIVRRHVFPNSISNIVTVGTFSVADAILALSFLGYLGFGVPLPGTDWGTMMANGQGFLINDWWWEIFPVAAVFVTVIVCINYIGDALRDIFEVRLRQR